MNRPRACCKLQLRRPAFVGRRRRTAICAARIARRGWGMSMLPPLFKRVVVKESGPCAHGLRAPHGRHARTCSVSPGPEVACWAGDAGVVVVVGGGNFSRGSRDGQGDRTCVCLNRSPRSATVMNALGDGGRARTNWLSERMASLLLLPCRRSASLALAPAAVCTASIGSSILLAGTGIGSFTTEIEPCARAAELSCAAATRRTQVDGIYWPTRRHHPISDSDRLSHDEA